MDAKSIEMPDVFKDIETWTKQHPNVVNVHWYLANIDVDIDLDGQVRAIRQLIERNRAIEAELIKKYRRIADDPNTSGDQVGDHLEGLAHTSVFQDAAHSMAAVGMLAPFLETVFYQCFRGIGNKWTAMQFPAGGHERWRSAHAFQWDCHFVIAKGGYRKDIVSGILQLAEAIGLQSQLPKDIELTLSALIAYRNKMFHCGFEWPPEERGKFQSQIDKSKWPATWFMTATSGGDPWIYYMSDEFIDHCMKTIDNVITAFGEFARDNLPRFAKPEQTDANLTE